ncbi:hypothetical protein [Catellatospora citrea]|uniref:Uncharacterized protein n=1 Tax=Catellatospora citrea TaxID=53366 RepID=A0A8J3P2N4_9ACTN|nr:hypothetical protein [Catellatospora citrea]RKE08329.1 hypothetical protein C8E86_3173 [Catellatospora citrea]GIG01367.1 hypothetical protein Cci01nite_64600 [Catellatospora citrea]
MNGAAYVRSAGVVLGGALSFTVANSPLIPLAVPLFTVFVLVGVAVSELMSPRPSRSGQPTAQLAARDVDAYLPPGARAHLRWLGLAVLVAVPPIAVQIGANPLALAGQFGGREAMLRLAPTAAILACWCLPARHLLRRIAEAGHAGLDPQHLVADEAWRRRASRLVLGTTGVLLSGTLAGAMFYYSQRAWLVFVGGWGWWMFVLLTLGLTAFLVFAHYLHLLIHPGPSGVVSAVARQQEPAEAVA